MRIVAVKVSASSELFDLEDVDDALQLAIPHIAQVHALLGDAGGRRAQQRRTFAAGVAHAAIQQAPGLLLAQLCCELLRMWVVRRVGIMQVIVAVRPRV